MATLQDILTRSPVSRQDSPYKGRRSRQVDGSQFGNDQNPMAMMLQETSSNAQHAEYMIAKQRDYEKIQQELYEEFKQLDIDQDGSISLEEILIFLQKKAGQNIDTRLAEELFQEIDKDQNGRISLVEFVESYFSQQMEVEERIEELKKMIDEDTKKRQEIFSKLQEIQTTEKINSYGIMVGSMLTANIIEARELKQSRFSGAPNPYVILEIEGQKQSTEQSNSADPLWNEIITFDIVTGKEPLIVQVYDRADIGKDSLFGTCEIFLDQLMDQYKHDEWFQIEDKNQVTGKIRINLHWIHSRKKFLQDILRIQDLAIEEENQEKQILEAQLQNMKSPFKFLQAKYVKKEVIDDKPTDPNKKMEQLQKRANLVERQVEQKFDEVTTVIAQKIGMKEIPWFKWTLYLTFFYSLITILVLFHRPDFLNLTVCTTALFMLFNIERVTQNSFRFLVLGIFISVIYDLFWFSLKSSEYSTDSKSESGVETSIKQFSLYMSYISFFTRLIMALIYWKDSLDFDNIMGGMRIQFAEQEQQQQHSPQSESPKSGRNQQYIRDISPPNRNNRSNFNF